MGVGTVGVFDGVAVLVSVLSRIYVGVGVNVAVGRRGVGDGCGVEVDAVGVVKDVSVGRAAATVGGTSIPASRSAVAPSPMKRPIPRNLILLRMVDGIFLVVSPVDGISFDVEVDIVPFGIVPDDVFVVVALPNRCTRRIQTFIDSSCGK